ncbi:DNA-binding protein [Sphingobacteriales bacterium UPWRP_1]|nr:hypothetical protein B6N25_14350 [Sphingobacteriales bacterium TSM_CSS]PSJ78891.1 DNA-binding protein [Sphingobacteriales bacterium UPWRP_1]
MQNFVLIDASELKQLLNDVLDAKLKQHTPPPPVVVTTELPELLTRKQAANLLNISLVTLQKHTDSGKLPAERLGHRVLYRKEAVFNALQKIKV